MNKRFQTFKVRTTQNKNWNQRQRKPTQISAKQNPKPCRYRLGIKAARQAVSVYGIWTEVPGSISRLIWWHRFNTSEWGLKQKESSFKMGVCESPVSVVRSLWKPLAQAQSSEAFGAPKPWKAAAVRAGWSQWHTWPSAQPGGLGILANNWQPARYIWLRLLRSSHQGLPRLLSKHSLEHKMHLNVKYNLLIISVWCKIPLTKNKNKKMGGRWLPSA